MPQNVTETKTISRSDYLKLVGVLTLAQSHNKALKDLEKIAAELVGEEHEYGGLSSDAVYGERDADSLLGGLNITIEET